MGFVNLHLVFFCVMLCGFRDKTVDSIIIKCSELTQKECKSNNDWAGEIIHRKLCKRLKMELCWQRELNNPPSVPDNVSYYYFLSMLVFKARFNWWFFIEVWETKFFPRISITLLSLLTDLNSLHCLSSFSDIQFFLFPFPDVFKH